MLKDLLYKAVREERSWLPLCLALYKIMKRDRRALQILSLNSIVCCEVVEKAELSPACQGYAYGPNQFLGKTQKIAKIVHPAIFYRLFKSARVSAHSSSVVINDKEIYVETISGEREDIDYQGGHLLQHGKHYAIVRTGHAEGVKQGVFLAGNGAYNYYHWLVEIAAKFQYIQELPSCYADFPILVSVEIQEVPSFKLILDALARGREVIYLDPRQSYIVENLLWIDTPNILPFNMFGSNLLRTEDCCIRRESIEYLRMRLIDAYGECGGAGDIERVFLARKPGKRDYNQDEVEALMVKYGFISVYMEDLRFQEQINIIRHAKVIVGPTGAAWTNLMFASPGVKCLCWMGEEYKGFSAFSNLAEIVGADLYYLTGRAGAGQTSRLNQRSYRIDVKDIERFVQICCV